MMRSNTLGWMQTFSSEGAQHEGLGKTAPICPGSGANGSGAASTAVSAVMH